MMLKIDGKKLFIVCANRCLSLTEMCKKADVSNCVLHNIKIGKLCHAKTVGKIAKALDVDASVLLEDEK